MTGLLLHGLASEAERMKRLCRAVNQLGYECRLRLWTTAEGTAPDSGCDNADLDAVDDTDHSAAIEIICWTEASSTSEGTAMQSHAVSLKEQQRYLGLLLDPVEPPSAVTGAQDIALHDWEAAADLTALAPLQSALTERLEGTPTINGIRAVISTLISQVRAISHRVQRMNRWLKGLGLFAIVGVSIGIFTFFGGLEQNLAGVCRIGPMTGLCRTASVGDVPSQDELDEWTRIERGSSCAAFEGYLARYGADAEYAAQARLRLDQAQGAMGESPMQIVYPILFSPTDRRDTRSEAIEALNARAQAEAVRYCAITAQNFEGEARPGKYTLTSGPNCVSYGQQFDCEADGYIECAFIRSDQNRTCPPLTDSSRNR